jgi:nucleotidyltransferase/DNA polymerase involved in DNA repair
VSLPIAPVDLQQVLRKLRAHFYKPVAVLNNGDSCVIARSNKANALGIEMRARSPQEG